MTVLCKTLGEEVAGIHSTSMRSEGGGMVGLGTSNLLGDLGSLIILIYILIEVILQLSIIFRK